MTFRDFEKAAHEAWEEIPGEYREGVDGVVVRKEAEPHPTIRGVYTLGECATEAYPSDWGGPETIRSVLVLYFGSFQRLDALDPDFDWEEELWETVTHELRHHLESLAAEDALEGVDYAADENFKRWEGEPYDPWFYRSGEARDGGLFQVERQWFLEIEYDSALGPPRPLDFHWRGTDYRIRPPRETGDVCFLWVEEGLEAREGAEELTLVLVRRRGFLGALRQLLSGGGPRVVEAAGAAEPEDDRSGGGAAPA